MARKPRTRKQVEALTHDRESRRNIPTAELESVMAEDDKSPIMVAYERRNRDLDPQLVWRGKDEQDATDLVVKAPPLYIQEKVHPKVLIDDLSRESRGRAKEDPPDIPDLFADFNGLPDLEAKTEFYQHDQNWSNRMILGDALQVMASLAEREGLRDQVQCIYIDPPYGIKFNSNFQWSTTSRDVRDGKREHMTREPEQVKAFRDTWRDGIHSYLTYLRDRLTVARDLLTESGSVFVQIGDENVHRVRTVMDEIFGDQNFVASINFKSTNPLGAKLLPKAYDYILWYAKRKEAVKFRSILRFRDISGDKEYRFVEEYPSPLGRKRLNDRDFQEREDKSSVFRRQKLTSSGFTPSCTFHFDLHGSNCTPFGRKSWATNVTGIERLKRANRLFLLSVSPYYKRYFGDAPFTQFDNTWTDQPAATQSLYVVQTATKFIQRCVLMTTDPGDLVLDPTCGAGTTAYVSEQWGRRWITIDTSRVALTLARARVMGARYPYYLLADSRDGQSKEAEITRRAPSESPTYGDVRQGFVYERVPHITLRAIANNAEIDVIHDRLQPAVEAALADLNRSLRGHDSAFRIMTGGRQGTDVHFDRSDGETATLPSGERIPVHALLEWEVPREAPDDWPEAAFEPLARFWQARIARQREIDAIIAARADFEYLYDKPYVDTKKVRVAGPFTFESLTPHRVVEAEMQPMRPSSADGIAEPQADYIVGKATPSSYDFTAVILEQLRTAGVQQPDKRGKIDFTSLTGWPGEFICAEGRYVEGAVERRAGILVGPEHGTVSRPDLIAAAREAGDAGFDVLIGCAFNYDAQCTDMNRLGRLPILKARMNADLHMSTDLKKTKGGNLFVIFGEPDIEVMPASDDRIQVKIKGVDLFDPRTGDVRSSEADELACWFIDTNYDMASFFVRHAYFLGANDPYKALKTTLKAEIDAEAWQSLHSDTSRPFRKPDSGRIAVKAINHLGDEVMKVLEIA